MALKLYSHPLASFCQKVLVALYENDTPFEAQLVDLGNAVSRAEFLRIFPNATQLDHRFPALEAWIEQEYKPLTPPLSLAGYQLYSRK